MAQFRDLAEYCRQLRREGLLNSGVEYFVNEEGLIDSRPIPCSESEGAVAVRRLNDILKGLNAWRSSLNRSKDLEEWRASEIGKFLQLLTEKLNQQLTRIEDYRRTGRTIGDSTYNSRVLIFFSKVGLEFFDLVGSADFQDKWRWSQSHALKKFAREFQERNGREQDERTMHANAEKIIAIDDHLRNHGNVKGLESTINALLNVQYPRF